MSAGLEEELLEKLLAKEGQTANVIEGLRRSVIVKMGLRDQPVLDQYQDEIFRMPLGMSLLILGPPGTGKTTTLIRRLGQKLDTVFLDKDEIRIVESVTTTSGVAHADSWLMFTPTELLKQYLKEAFAQERVPASDQRIKTWSDYRREHARNTFGILKTTSGGGSFILKDSVDILSADALDNLIAWFSDYEKWQRSIFVNEIRLSANGLSGNSAPEIAAVGQRLLSIIHAIRGGTLASAFISLADEVTGIRALVDSMKEVTDKKIRDVLNLQLNRNKSFIDELASFINSLQLSPDDENVEPDDQDSDED